MEVSRECTTCGREFVLPSANYHRKRCWTCLPLTTNGTRVEVACEMCGKTFALQPGKARDLRKRGVSFYCGEPCKGRRRAVVNGGTGHRCLTADGYVMVYVVPEERAPYRRDSPTEREHRVVMARILGRHLEPGETVHHINGDRADNRPENLQVRYGRHGKGHVLRCRCCGSSDIETVELD